MAKKYHVSFDVELLNNEDEEFLNCVDHHIEYLLNLDEWALNVSNAHATEIVSDASCVKVGKHDPSSFQLIGQHWVGRKER